MQPLADFSRITRPQILPKPTDIPQELGQMANEMLCQQLP